MSFVEEQEEKQRGVGKTILWVVGAILIFILAKGAGALFGRATVDQFRDGYGESSADAEIDAGIEKLTSELRGQLPIKVDQITTLVGIAHFGKQIQYMMTIDGELDPSLIPDVRAEQTEINRTNVCRQHPDVPKLFEHGVTMTWQYTDSAGEKFEVSIDRC